MVQGVKTMRGAYNRVVDQVGEDRMHEIASPTLDGFRDIEKAHGKEWRNCCQLVVHLNLLAIALHRKETDGDRMLADAIQGVLAGFMVNWMDDYAKRNKLDEDATTELMMADIDKMMNLSVEGVQGLHVERTTKAAEKEAAKATKQ